MSCRQDNVDCPSRRGVRRALLLGLLLTGLLGGCSGGEPEGQVIAVVNGEEVTISELNEEARARGLVVGDDRALQRSLLQEIVDRKLLAQAASRAELDRTPEYLLATRRASELALAQQLVATAAEGAQAPTNQQLREIVDSNPQAFAARAVITVEQLTVRGSLPGAEGRTIDALAADLSRRKIPFTRSTETWDTATLEPAQARKLLGATREVLILDSQGHTAAVQVISSLPKPVVPAEISAKATEWWRNRRAQAAAQALLSTERQSAKIRLQQGFSRDN